MQVIATEFKYFVGLKLPRYPVASLICILEHAFVILYISRFDASLLAFNLEPKVLDQSNNLFICQLNTSWVSNT